MGFKYLIWGCVFFFLPNLSFIDILPDFIGCILILKGLTKISDLAPKLFDAKEAFKKVLIIGIAQFAVMFLAFSWLKTDAGLILVASFVFAVLDLIFLLPAFRNLLDAELALAKLVQNKIHQFFAVQGKQFNLILHHMPAILRRRAMKNPSTPSRLGSSWIMPFS